MHEATTAAVEAGSEGGRRPDRGSPRGAKIAWVIATLLLCVVFGMNQFMPEPPTPETGSKVPDGDQFAITAKVFVKLANAGPLFDNSRGMVASQVAAGAMTPEDKVRAAIVTAELSGAEAGLDALDAIEVPSDVAGAARLNDDIDLVGTALYEGPLGLSPEQRQAFEDRFGWFARLALSNGLANDHPERAPLLAGGARLVLGLTLAGIAALVALVGGLVACVMMVLDLLGGRVRPAFVPPAPGGSLWIETAAVFIGGFLLMHVAKEVVGAVVADPPRWLFGAGIGVQWLLGLAVFWPRLRGMPRDEWCAQIGWHTGRGVLREVGAGVYAYFAGLPVLGLAMLLTMLIVMIREFIAIAGGGERPAPPDNPILEVLTKATGFEIALLAGLAVVWAPLVEESIFRGALFRQLRGRRGVWLSAVVSALFFGLMHGYEYMLLLPVTTIGFLFAFIREWRGSLIPVVTAHALHNGTLLLLAIMVLGAL